MSNVRLFVGSCLIAALGLGVVTRAQSHTRLVVAMKNQDATTVKALLKQRADVNAPDVDGTTALQWAAHWNDVDTVKALIAAGAKANVASRYGVTPLHEAASIGSAPIVIFGLNSMMFSPQAARCFQSPAVWSWIMNSFGGFFGSRKT